MAQAVAKGLREHAYAVDVAGDGNDALYHASINNYDVILLDVLLPGRDGFDAGSVKTQPSARTMAFDPKTGKIFLSAAEYVETPPTTPGARPQRSIKPGSFVVLVVGK
jgi:CheY-like chemotaxis protein